MRDVGGRDAASGDLLLFTGCIAVALLAYGLPRPWAAELVGAIRRTALRPVVQLQSRAAQDRTSRFRLSTVQAAHDTLALRILEDSALRTENTQLRALVGLRQRGTMPWVPAEVLHRPTPTDGRALMLDVGTEQGIARFDPVMTPDGLLGSIWSASPIASTVLTWMHPDWRASAVTGDGTVMGILAPAVVGTSGQPLLELRGVALRDSLPNGTLVFTSGLGGVYPRMVPIGRVVGVEQDPLGYERLYRVAPFVNPGLVSHVMVLTAPRDSVYRLLPEDSLP